MSKRLKFGFLVVVIMEIGVIFYLLRVYNRFVSSPDNYYKNILTHRAEKEYLAE